MITIGVALIADDSLVQLKRLLPQLEKFDQIVIGWNGSDPEVKKYLDQLCTPKKSPYEYFQFDWRGSFFKGNDCEEDCFYDINDWGFCYARNLTFKKLHTTHALWLDTDDLIGYVRDGKDVVVSADQAYKAFKKIATEAPDDIDVWFSTYIYSRDAYNNPNVVHARERLIKDPLSWKWVYPIHEVLVPDREPKWAMIKDVQIIHYPPQKEETSANRNFRMLNEWKEQLESYGTEYEHDLGRCCLYIGDTYWALNDYKASAAALVEFICKHPNAITLEKWQAWCFIAKCQIELNNFEAARAAALAAIDLEPGLCDGYILLAQVKLLTEQDPQAVLLLMEAAGHAQEPPPQVITNPLDYSYTIYCISSKCKYLLGDCDAALDWALRALKVAPNDPRAEQLRSDAAIQVRERDSVEAAKALYRLYLDYDENEKAAGLYKLLPYSAQRNEEIIEAANLANKRVRHLFDREEYVKLYEENSKWEPVPEYMIDSDDIPDEARMRYTLGRLKLALPNGGRILDVGCADGYHSLIYAKHGYEVVGVDLDSRCVDLANERAQARNLPAKFVHGFFEEMNPEKTLDPFDVDQYFNESASVHSTSPSNWYQHFDAVICSEVIEHVQNPQFLMGCLVDCAKDNAPVIITTPDEAFDKGDVPAGGGMYEEDKELAGHVRVFTQESFEALLKSDPEVDVVESHFVALKNSYREHQGWQVGEIRRRPHAQGPIIRVLCGDRVEFSPEDINTKGIGGSETAVVHMARYWAAFGCQVVVYNGRENGIYDGVFYRHAKQYSDEHYSDIFISWRQPTAFKDQRPNAKTTIFWAHDLYYPFDRPKNGKYPWPKEWADRIDLFVALSQFHKKYLVNVHPGIPEEKVWVSRNGIDPGRYLGKKIEKVPHRYFYSSSWDRGLEELVEVWPDIKEAIPDAELHVAYGTVIAEKVYKLTGEYDKLNRMYRVLSAMKTTPGIKYYESIGQQELADLQLSCEAWLYPPQPTHENGAGGFLETYCISAVEAQAARCVPITRLNGALTETVQNCIGWTHRSNEEVIEFLGDGFEHWPHFESNQEWALKQTWESLAIEWLMKLAPKEEKEVVE